VDFGTVPAALKGYGPDFLTAMSPPGVGTVDVRVTNLFGTSPATPVDRFAAPHPLGPTITTLDPTGGPIDAAMKVKITGTGFASDIGPYAVTFGSAPATVTAGSLTEITVVAPQLGSGTVPVQLNTKQGPATWSDQFEYGIPLVTGIAPSAGVATGTTVHIAGFGFDDGCSVTFGNKTVTPTTVQPNIIEVTTPTVLLPEPYEIVDVTVTNKAGKTSPVTPDSKYIYYQKPKAE